MAAVKPGQFGFRDLSADTKPRRRLIISIMGDQKTGKNHFAFGAKGTKAFHSFDFGDEGVVEKFLAKGHKIKKAEYIADIGKDATPQQMADAWGPVYSAFKANYAIGLATADTTIVDTLTEAYEGIRLAHFGKLVQVAAHNYAPVNAEMKDLFRQAYTSGKSVIFLNRMKDEYTSKTVGGKEVSYKTGQRTFAGYSQTPFEVQVHMRSFRDTEGFKMEILDCRQNPDLNGMVLEGEMNSFAMLGQLVFPESDEGDWL